MRNREGVSDLLHDPKWRRVCHSTFQTRPRLRLADFETCASARKGTGHPEGPDIGYVNLYYLVPEARGSDLSERLDEYVWSFYADLGIKRARLHVGPAYSRAIRFYEKHGWKNLGPDPRHPEILLFERTFEIG
jgi:GNAT superfamily N-acetyltransferase